MTKSEDIMTIGEDDESQAREGALRHAKAALRTLMQQLDTIRNH